MLQQIQNILFVEYANATCVGIAASIALIIALIVTIFKQHGKWKHTVASLEDALVITKDNAAKQVSEEKTRANYQISCARRESAEALAAEQKRSADAIAEEEQRATDAIVAEQKRSADAIAAEQQRSAEAIAVERKRSEDELRSLRERIAAEKEALNRLSEKELIVRTVMALGGYAGRLDRIEAQSLSLLQDVSTEMKAMLESEIAVILQGFYSEIDKLGKEVKSMEDEVKTTGVAAVDGLKAEVEALREEIRQVGEDTVNAIEEADDTCDDSELRELIENLQSNVKEIKDSIYEPYHHSGLREKVDAIDENVDRIASEVSSIRSDVSSMQFDISDIKSSS